MICAGPDVEDLSHCLAGCASSVCQANDLGHGVVRQYAPVDGRHRLPGRRAQLRGRPAGVGDLAEQVDHLPGPADEVAGRHVAVEVVAAGQHLRQRLAARPAVRSARRSRASGSRVQLQRRAPPRRPRARPTASPSRRPRRRPGRAAPRPARRLAAGLVEHHRHGARPARPGDSPSHTPRRRHSATSRSASVQIRPSIRPASVTSPSPDEVAARRRAAPHDPVERAGQRPGAAGDPLRAAPRCRARSRSRRSAQRACSSRSGQAWQGCRRSCVAQLRRSGGRRRRPPAAPAAPPTCRSRPVPLTARGQVAAGGRRAVVEVLGHPDPGQHLGRRR